VKLVIILADFFLRLSLYNASFKGSAELGVLRVYKNELGKG